MPAPAPSPDYQKGLRLSRDGRHADAIGCFERALQREPNDARVLFALGNTARVLGLAEGAEQFYRRVLALEPERLEALVNLANVLRAASQFAAAEALLAPALARNPESAELWLTLGSVYREMGDAEKAEAHYREALARKPDYTAALVNLADLLSDAGQHDEALVLYDRALKREPHNSQARLNRAILHLLRGNLPEGWRDYAARLKIPGKAPLCDHKLPKWNGTPLKRTRLLVTAEQGVGDQLMFASMIPELAARTTAEGGSLILECEPRLVSLFARSFPDVSVRPSDMTSVHGSVTTHYGWLKASGGAKAAVEMGSLPRILRASLSEFPNPNAFLLPDPDEREGWRVLFDAFDGPRIGICWRSGKMGGARNLQFAPSEAWANFLRDLTGTIVCAQYDASNEEIAALERMSGRRILVPQGIDQKQELDRTCAMLAALDAVISAPTAVSWLSAGAGVPTYKILYDTSWTGFGTEFEPFAPSCRCVMPEHAGVWADTFSKAAMLLSARFAAARPAGA
jgi:tetratricopeptide (TPR) repeat protein